MHQQRRHGRVYAARQPTDDATSLANLRPNAPNRLIHERAWSPVGGAATDMKQEVLQQFAALRGMPHLRMKLDTDMAEAVSHRGKCPCARTRHGDESRRRLTNTIAMAHP